MRSTPTGGRRSQAWDNAAPPARTTRATALPAPSPPEISLAASSLCTAQSRSSSLESSVSFLRHSNLTVVESRELNQSLLRRGEGVTESVPALQQVDPKLIIRLMNQG